MFVKSDDVDAVAIQIPGAKQDGLEAQLLNLDLTRGIIATIIHFKPGVLIPAHFHNGGSEAHFVLEGSLIDAGRTCGPGTFLTHAAGVVHGPHSSPDGCSVLTIRTADFGTDDHHVVEDASTEDPSNLTTVSPVGAADPRTEVPEGDKSAATPDNPTNPPVGARWGRLTD